MSEYTLSKYGSTSAMFAAMNDRIKELEAELDGERLRLTAAGVLRGEYKNEIKRLKIALRVKTEYYDCCAEDVVLLAAENEALRNRDGLHMVISGAVFDFGGFLTTRKQTIEVGETADASPMADLIKEWASLRCLSLDDAAVLSWQSVPSDVANAEPLQTTAAKVLRLHDEMVKAEFIKRSGKWLVNEAILREHDKAKDEQLSVLVAENEALRKALEWIRKDAQQCDSHHIEDAALTALACTPETSAEVLRKRDAETFRKAASLVGDPWYRTVLTKHANELEKS